MHFAFSEEQEQLRRSARSFLEAHAPLSRTRAGAEGPTGFDAALWERVCSELGWTALVIPEAHGGFGTTWIELGAVLEECGRALLPLPFFSTIALGANALLVAGSAEQQAAHLPGIAAGTTRATLAWRETSAATDAVHTTLTRSGDGYQLEGRKRYVVDGASADLVIVLARLAGSVGDEGLTLVAVDAATPGVARRRVPTLDCTRPLADVELRGASVPASAVLGEPGRAAPLLRRVLDRAGIALAAEQLGGAERCLDMAVDYAKVRTQFGRAIGSFQAIKHACADLLVAVETARSAAYYAAWAAATGSQELAPVAALTRSHCSDAFFRCAAQNIQIHGGVGFTWEHEAHLYFKRARASRSLLGTPSGELERIAEHLAL